MSTLKKLMLQQPSLTLAAAESLTSGRVQAEIGRISGASHFFVGGITAYSLDQKVRHLGVKRAAAQAVNSVSSAVAEQMAKGACALFDADVGVATTGYAEPAPEWAVPEPFAWWAVAHRTPGRKFAVRSGQVSCAGLSRAGAQKRAAEAALKALIAWLIEIRSK